MEWDCRPATVRVSILAVGSSLADFREAKPAEKRHHLARLQDGRPGHGLRHLDGLNANEVAFEPWIAVFQKHLDHFLDIRPQFVERLALAMRPREARDPAHVQSGIGVPLDDRRE